MSRPVTGQPLPDPASPPEEVDRLHDGTGGALPPPEKAAEEQEPTAAETGAALPPAIAALAFLAKHFGRRLDPRQLMTGLPVGAERAMSSDLLDECAARGGLRLTRVDADPGSLKASMLPALWLQEDGEAFVLMHREGTRLECADARTGTVTWREAASLTDAVRGACHVV